ncbi:hypothetical protein GCM10018783_04210 [Streptomyces griseosporeus]|nr:hypothetical protein GCM10018783_04210 [Streptomyces griseosporeus]
MEAGRWSPVVDPEWGCAVMVALRSRPAGGAGRRPPACSTIRAGARGGHEGYAVRVRRGRGRSGAVGVNVRVPAVAPGRLRMRPGGGASSLGRANRIGQEAA